MGTGVKNSLLKIVRHFNSDRIPLPLHLWSHCITYLQLEELIGEKGQRQLAQERHRRGSPACIAFIFIIVMRLTASDGRYRELHGGADFLIALITHI